MRARIDRRTWATAYSADMLWGVSGWPVNLQLSMDAIRPIPARTGVHSFPCSGSLLTGMGVCA